MRDVSPCICDIIRTFSLNIGSASPLCIQQRKMKTKKTVENQIYLHLDYSIPPTPALMCGDFSLFGGMGARILICEPSRRNALTYTQKTSARTRARLMDSNQRTVVVHETTKLKNPASTTEGIFLLICIDR